MLHLDLLLPQQLLWGEEEEGEGGEIKVNQMLDLLTPNRHLNSRPFWTCCNGFVSENAKTLKNYRMSILCKFSTPGVLRDGVVTCRVLKRVSVQFSALAGMECICGSLGW